jgi:hypothetical protein
MRCRWRIYSYRTPLFYALLMGILPIIAFLLEIVYLFLKLKVIKQLQIKEPANDQQKKVRFFAQPPPSGFSWLRS